MWVKRSLLTSSQLKTLSEEGGEEFTRQHTLRETESTASFPPVFLSWPFTELKFGIEWEGFFLSLLHLS